MLLYAGGERKVKSVGVIPRIVKIRFPHQCMYTTHSLISDDNKCLEESFEI